MQQLKQQIKAAFDSAPDKITFMNEIREFLHREISPVAQPIDFVRWIAVDDVEPNDYNPNSVAKVEMGLLYKSIKHDGYTQPIVAIFDPIRAKYVIVDGFHRYFTCKMNPDIYARNSGYLPVVVIEKDINERMAATVRHNRARGEHSVTGMSNMVFEMLQNGWTDEKICNHLGMEPEEVLKLKHITGFSALFSKTEHSKEWKTPEMIKWEFEDRNGNKT